MERFTGSGLYGLFSKNAADIYPGRYSEAYCETLAALANEAKELLLQKRILLLVHNYQYPELQELARAAGGYIGDSLGLTLKARDTDYRTIAYCSVEFMAQTAKILLPERRVLIPNRPGCSLVSSVDLKAVERWKEEHPGGLVLAYINTDAATKALCDCIYTSRNAEAVFAHILAGHPHSPILSLPDQFLTRNVMRKLKERGLPIGGISVWNGFCHVHRKIGELALVEAAGRYPAAEILIHPECGCTSFCLTMASKDGRAGAVPFLSTEGMMLRAMESVSLEFIVATEIGMAYRLRRDIPEKTFWPVSRNASCEYMKMITIENLVACLRDDTDPAYEITVARDDAAKARLAIERMLDLDIR